MKGKTSKQLKNDLNLLRSRHVAWILEQETVWKREEWLDAHEFNSAVVKLFDTPLKIAVNVLSNNG